MYKIKLYKEILEYFQDDLDALDLKLKSLLFENRCTGLNSDSQAFMDDIEHFLFAKSKRLRPVVLFLIRNALLGDMPLRDALSDTAHKEGENSLKDSDIQSTLQKINNLAAALELLHSATLIHDDIIDEAHLRRGMETFNIKYNPHIATIAGDYLLSLCLKVLSKIGYCEIFSYFAENTLNICNGEIDQFFNKNKAVTIETYLNKSKDKTSSLFMAGVKSLLYLIDKEIKPIDDETKKGILGYTLNFSLGFQIYDDIENFANENNEKASSDIENGIYTLPYLYLLQQEGFYGMIDADLHNDALSFSKEYLNKILDEAIKHADDAKIHDKSLLIKLIEVFKD